MKTMDWAGELMDLFSGSNTEATHKAIQDPLNQIQSGVQRQCTL
jgi:hypothetical protein